MKYTTKYIGLDVSKEKIAVAIAEEGREPARFYGVIAHRMEAVRKLVKQLGEPESLQICYEAGATGFDLHRLLTQLGVKCEVIAPSLIPQRSGDRVKTDRRDAIQLAQLHRAGELTSIYIPTIDDEAMRDLIRARQDAKEDLHRARQRLLAFLLRHHIYQPSTMKHRWTKIYHAWLAQLSFSLEAQHVAFSEYLTAIREIEARIVRIEDNLRTIASAGAHQSIIQALQGLRGIALLTAITLAYELGSFARFSSPKQLMAYIGLVPREYSSGETVRRGRLTRAGNKQVRKALVESAWSYRHRPAVKGQLAKRLEGQSAAIHQISLKAQHRLHKKYNNLVHGKGKPKTLAIGAVARELVGFIWAVAQTQNQNQSA